MAPKRPADSSANANTARKRQTSNQSSLHRIVSNETIDVATSLQRLETCAAVDSADEFLAAFRDFFAHFCRQQLQSDDGDGTSHRIADFASVNVLRLVEPHVRNVVAIPDHATAYLKRLERGTWQLSFAEAYGLLEQSVAERVLLEALCAVQAIGYSYDLFLPELLRTRALRVEQRRAADAKAHRTRHIPACKPSDVRQACTALVQKQAAKVPGRGRGRQNTGNQGLAGEHAAIGPGQVNNDAASSEEESDTAQAVGAGDVNGGQNGDSNNGLHTRDASHNSTGSRYPMRQNTENVWGGEVEGDNGGEGILGNRKDVENGTNGESRHSEKIKGYDGNEKNVTNGYTKLGLDDSIGDETRSERSIEQGRNGPEQSQAEEYSFAQAGDEFTTFGNDMDGFDSDDACDRDDYDAEVSASSVALG